MYPKYNKGNENMTFPIPFGCLKKEMYHVVNMGSLELFNRLDIFPSREGEGFGRGLTSGIV
jgi:hypothetical protein